VLVIVKSLKKQNISYEDTIHAYSVGGERMTNVGEIYVCKICGNAVEVVVGGAGILVCCGQPMERVEEENE